MAIEKSGLAELLTQPNGQFTMVAPSNSAFRSLGAWEKKAFEKLTPMELKKVGISCTNCSTETVELKIEKKIVTSICLLIM